MSEINDMRVSDGVKLIIKAYEKREEDKAFQMYIARYANMDESTYESFEEFYNPNRLVQSDRSAEEILEEVQETIDTYRGRWE